MVIRLSSLSVVTLVTGIAAVAYVCGAYNHERDIVSACNQFGSAKNISWTGKLDICTEIDSGGIVIAHRN